MGYKRLYNIMKKREDIYAKTEFTEEDGLRSAQIESDFSEMNGYEAEAEAAVLLSGLGISEDLRTKKMRDLEAGDKVRVLLAQALLAIRISCCWTNRPIISILNPLNGWKSSSPALPIRSSWFPMIVTF